MANETLDPEAEYGRLAFDAFALVRPTAAVSVWCNADMLTGDQEKWDYSAPTTSDQKQWEQLVYKYLALKPLERFVSRHFALVTRKC